MNKTIKLFLGIALMFSLGLSSCEYSVIEPVVIELPDDPISFSADIQSIFTAKCLTCHTNTKPVLLETASYNNLFDEGLIDLEVPSSSILYTLLETGHPGGNNAFSALELAQLLKWIEEGALDN